jgi:hypothetical protein
MSRFVSRKRSSSRPGQARIVRLESLEHRTLLAANSIGQIVPDFQLVDVNPNSATYNTQVSPRDLVGQAGAFYFVHST